MEKFPQTASGCLVARRFLPIWFLHFAAVGDPVTPGMTSAMNPTSDPIFHH